MANSTLASRLRILRKEKNLTQTEIAREIKISNTTLSQYESGKRLPSFDVLRQLSELFDCTADYLLGFNDHRRIAGKAALSGSELSALENIKNADSALFSAILALNTLGAEDLQTVSQILTVFVAKRD